MTGLMDTFRRHSAVLTNIPVNEVKSRRYWPGGHICEVLHQGRHGCLTGPVGWVQDRPRAPVRPSSDPHHSRPVQGLTGPLRWDLTSPRAAGWVPVLPLPLPTHYTRPRYPPSAHHGQCGPCTVRAHLQEQSVLGHCRRT